MTTLEELWYGNIIPWEQFVKNNPQLKSQLSVLSKNRDKLTADLTEKQKESLEKYNDTVNKTYSITQLAAFQYGFSLGVRLITESMLTTL